MEIKTELKKPYTEKQRMDFIVEQNHNKGYEIKETESELQAWGYTDEEITQQEKEKIKNLTCTKRVFALALQSLGINYTQIKEIISTNEQAQLEWDLCERLERSNPLIDIMGEKYGLKPEDFDAIFIKANM